MAKFRVEMLNGDVYQLEGVTDPEVDALGNLVWHDYRRVPTGFVSAGQWRIVGEWLKAQKMEVNTTEGA